MSKGPRIRSAVVWGPEKRDVPAQAKRTNSSFLCIFLLFRPSNDFHKINQGDLYLSTDLNANLFQKHPYRYTQKLCYQLSGHPWTRSNWHIKFAITGISERWHLQGVCCIPSSFHLGLLLFWVNPSIWKIDFDLKESPPLIYFNHEIWVEMSVTSALGKVSLIVERDQNIPIPTLPPP